MNNLSRRLQGRIMASMRRLWLTSETRREVIKSVTQYGFKAKKDGSPSRRRIIVGYKCNSCAKIVDKVEVDHIETVHSGNTFIDRLSLLWCDQSGLQALCKPCHQAKTNQERRRK